MSLTGSSLPLLAPRGLQPRYDNTPRLTPHLTPRVSPNITPSLGRMALPPTPALVAAQRRWSVCAGQQYLREGESDPELSAVSMLDMPISPPPPPFLATCLGAVLAAVVSVIDNAPYGLVLFPQEHFGPGLAPVGVAMVLCAAAVSQLVLSRSSAFPCAVGCMVVENLPFLTMMASRSAAELKQQGRGSQAVATAVLLWALATGLSGVAMLLLGHLHAGRLTAFFPKHVLLGCIGGMGAYILTQGISVTTGVPWGWAPAKLVQNLQDGRWILLLPTIACTAAIPLLQSSPLGGSPLTMPAYLLLLPCLFWAVVLSMGWFEAARDAGWLISEAAPPAEEQHPAAADGPQSVFGTGLLPWTLLFNGGGPAWDLIPEHLLTMAGVAVFTCLHVPVNSPSLAVSTGYEMELNTELIAHGYSNLAAFATGGLQNYMVFATSDLLHRCGGGGRRWGVLIAAVLIAAGYFGADALILLPRPLAGVVLLHIGRELLYDALVASLDELTTTEWSQVVLVILCMLWLDFMQGLGVGLVLACASFVAAAASADPVENSTYAVGMRSKRLRQPAEQRQLDDLLGREVYILRLCSTALFFGNSVAVLEHCEVSVFCTEARPSFLVLHFAAPLAGADCTAAANLAEVAARCNRFRICCVFCGLPKSAKTRVRSAGAKLAKFFPTINLALEYVEDKLLRAPVALPGLTVEAMLGDLAGGLVVDEDVEELAQCCTRQVLPGGAVLWRAGEESDAAYLLESGTLGVPVALNPQIAGCQAQTKLHCPQHGRLIEVSLPGQLSGEIAAFAREKRRVTCVTVATGPAVLWRLAVAVVERNPAALRAAQCISLRLASHRLRHLTLLGHLHSV
eukprot:TRINITY_DN13453_c1_g1_i1.p1 TRINITY_DN13453_c1_g1~~TRINITY_DN13453_c1_g1_i1.p1  ORF type:complete len:877 (+),score=218.18 TRINITY_DN13453_c1_g1_i1:81-2633(+)